MAKEKENFNIEHIGAQNVSALSAKLSESPGMEMPDTTQPEWIQAFLGGCDWLDDAEKAEIQAIIDEMPPNMQIRPVLYRVAERDACKEVRAEFEEKIQPAYFIYLANHYPEALKDAGICDHGVAQMRMGLAPSNPNGDLYNFDVDHVLEIAGSGLLAKSRSFDDHLDSSFTQHEAGSLMPNHMRNLYFLPRALHMKKNRINDLMLRGVKEEGQERIILMMVPDIKPNDNPVFDPAKAPHYRAQASADLDTDIALAEVGRLDAYFTMMNTARLLTLASAAAASNKNISLNVRSALVTSAINMWTNIAKKVVAAERYQQARLAELEANPEGHNLKGIKDDVKKRSKQMKKDLSEALCKLIETLADLDPSSLNRFHAIVKKFCDYNICPAGSEVRTKIEALQKKHMPANAA